MAKKSKEEQKAYFNWGPGTKVKYLDKEGVIKGYIPLSKKFIVEFKDKIVELLPEELQEISEENHKEKKLPVKETIDKIESKKELSNEDRETSHELLLRLASRGEGVTLSELSAGKASPGPFVNTIRAALSRNLITKTTELRNKEEVYKIVSSPSLSTTSVEQTLERVKKVAFEKVRTESFCDLDELGDLFIALGKILKKRGQQQHDRNP